MEMLVPWIVLEQAKDMDTIDIERLRRQLGAQFLQRKGHYDYVGRMWGLRRLIDLGLVELTGKGRGAKYVKKVESRSKNEAS